MPYTKTPQKTHPGQKISPNPPCHSKKVVKAGIRQSKNKSIQRYLCRGCDKTFSTQPITRTSYPPKIILTAVSLYNMGYTLEEARTQIRTRFKMDPKIPTIHSWLERYKHICTFLPLRRKYTIDPRDIIQSKRFHHQQVYKYRFHKLKLNIAGKQFPELKQYISVMLDDPMDHLLPVERRSQML